MSNPLSNSLRVIRANLTDPDAALNQAGDEENIKRYTKYLIERDPDAAPLVEGVTPTWFVVKRLPAAYLSAVLNGIDTISMRREHAVRAACHRIEVADGDALSAVPSKGAAKGTPFTTRDAVHGVTLAGDDWIQEIADRFGAETVQEIGQIAIDLARLPKGRRGPFLGWGGTAASP